MRAGPAILLGLLALGPGVAAAESAALQTETITVTGDRSPRSVEGSALAVTVVGEDEIRLIAAQHPSELVNRAPGALIHRGNGAEHLTAIRSPVLTGGDGAGSFLYLEDGVPLRAAGFSNVNGLFEAASDLASGVEIVRGPGSAVHGSNALHGLVNWLSPDPRRAAKRLEWEAGSFGRYRGRADLTASGDNWAGWVGLAALHEDGWRREAGLDRQVGQARLDGEAGRWSWRATAAFVNLNQETAGFTTDYRDLAVARANADPEAFRDAWAARGALALTREMDGGGTLTLTPYLRANRMDFRMHFLPSEALEASGHDSLGLQAVWRPSMAGGSVFLGLDVERTRGELSETQDRPTIFSFVQGVHYDYAVIADTAAVYVQGEWRAGPRLTVTGGARLEATRYLYDNRTADGAIGRFLRLPDRTDEYLVLTPHAGAVFELSSDHRLFARLARGARAPQTAELYRLQPGQEIDGIDPVTLDSAELGWRGDAAGGLQIELVAFAMEKRHVFFRDADGFNVTDARTRHHGVEFALARSFSDSWRASIAGSWARHRYASDHAVARSSDTIRSGAEIDTAPEWLWTADLVWAPLDTMDVAAEWIHVGDYATDAGGTAAYDGHDLVNLRARWRPRDGVEFFGALRNLADTAYAERADFAFGRDRFFPGEPRALSFGVRLTR